MSERSLHDMAAERAVLSGMFQYGNEVWADIADIVTVRTLDESNQILFRCLTKCLDESEALPDYPSLVSAANTLGLPGALEKTEDIAYIRALASMPVQKENVRRLAGRIRTLEVTRLLDAQLEQARASVANVTGDEPIDEILSLAEGPIFDFTSLLADSSGGTIKMGQGASEYALYLMDNPRSMMGISTGLPLFDQSIGGGLRVNSVDVIAARPKTGKSFAVDNISLYIAKQGIPVFNLDTEMSQEEHLHRIFGNLSGVPVRDIEEGKCGLTQLSRLKVLQAAKQLEELPYYYECVIGKAFEEILASMRRWVMKTVGLGDNGKAKPCVIIYDYLKMMSADFLSQDLKEYQALGFITTALKNFMGRFGVACLCFAQLNRDGIDREDPSGLAGADRIVHYCTSLTFYKKKTEEERAEGSSQMLRYTHKLVPICSRHGPDVTPGDYINIEADYKHGRILEGPSRNQLAVGVQAPQGIKIDDGEQDGLSLAG